MKNSLIAKITLSTFIASISTIAIAPEALAIIWSVSGTFDDGGTISGTFDFTGTDTYSNVNLTTTPGTLLGGNNYNDVDDSIIIGDGLGLIVEDSNPDLILDLSFDSSLEGITTPTTINLNTFSTEDDFSLISGQRTITAGTVSTAVPFEFSPTLGILLVGGIWGLSYLKKKKSSSINNN